MRINRIINRCCIKAPYSSCASAVNLRIKYILSSKSTTAATLSEGASVHANYEDLRLSIKNTLTLLY